MSGASEVNSVNERKDTLNVSAAERKMIYLDGLSKVSVSRKEYSFEVSQALLAAPHFSKFQ